MFCCKILPTLKLRSVCSFNPFSSYILSYIAHMHGLNNLVPEHCISVVANDLDGQNLEPKTRQRSLSSKWLPGRDDYGGWYVSLNRHVLSWLLKQEMVC